MNRRNLPTELEGLTQPERMARLIAFGRNAHDPKVAALLDSLAQGDAYERWLVLQTCYTSRDTARLRAALTDDSATLRRFALGLLIKFGDDATLIGLLTEQTPRQRVATIATLRKWRRSTVIDAFLRQLGPTLPPELLPFASPEVLAQQAPQSLANWQPHDWQRLAAFQPQFAADTLTQRIEQSDRYDPQFVGIVNAVLPPLAKRAPDRALALLPLLQRHYKLRQFTLDALALVRPQQVLDLLMASNEPLQLTFDPLIKHLSIDQLDQLFNNPTYEYDVSRWFLQLKPDQRRKLFERNQVRWRDNDGVIDDAIVAALPTDLRVPEARRHLALPALAVQEARRARYAALLPWDEASEYLRDTLRSNDIDLRGAALAALINTARYEARYSEVFALFTAHRREPEPVRATMLNALRQLPPSIWRAEDLPELEGIITTAFNAVDRSYQSLSHIQTILHRLMPFHPEWATTQFVQHIGKGMDVDEYSFSRTSLLPSAAVQRAAETLQKLNQTTQKRLIKQYVTTLAYIFQQRAADMPVLLDLLEQQALKRDKDLAYAAVSALIGFAPKRLHTIMPQLLGKWANWIISETIFTYVQKQRPDLLATYLPRAKLLLQPDSAELPPIVKTMHWSSTLQQQFAKQLMALQAKVNIYAQGGIIDWLAALPALDPSPLLQLSALKYEPTYVRDKALQALGQLDSTQGIATLLEALNDDRSLIAIRSLSHLLKRLPTAQALGILQNIPLKQVTVAKEVMRMCGTLGTPAAYQFLLDQAQQPLHHDVRVALIFALQYYLDQPSAWALLRQVAAEPESTLAISALSIPQQRIASQHYANWLDLLAQLLAHPDIMVRLQTLNRIAMQPIIDQARTLHAPLLALLNASYELEHQFAASAFVALYAHDAPSLLADTVQRMLPQRRVLHDLLIKIEERISSPAGVPTATIRAVLAVLATEPLTLTYQLNISLTAGLRDDIIAILRHASVTDDLLHADAMMLLIEQLEFMSRDTPALVTDIESTFRTDPDPRLRRIALAALISIAEQTNWNNELRALLEQYRTDSAPIVAATAQFTFTPDM